MKKNGIFSALPSAMSFIVLLILGPIFDASRKRKCLSDTVLRKIWHSIGTILPAIVLFGVSQLDTTQNKYIVIALLTLANAISEGIIILNLNILLGNNTNMLNLLKRQFREDSCTVYWIWLPISLGSCTVFA